MNLNNKSLKNKVLDLNVSTKARNLKYQFPKRNFSLLKNYLQNSSLEFRKSLSVTFLLQKSSCVIKYLVIIIIKWRFSHEGRLCKIYLAMINKYFSNPLLLQASFEILSFELKIILYIYNLDNAFLEILFRRFGHVTITYFTEILCLRYNCPIFSIFKIFLAFDKK